MTSQCVQFETLGRRLLFAWTLPIESVSKISSAAPAVVPLIEDFDFSFSTVHSSVLKLGLIRCCKYVENRPSELVKRTNALSFNLLNLSVGSCPTLAGRKALS